MRRGGWEPEPSAPDSDPESDCQCQLLVSSTAPLGLQLWKAQCAQSIFASLWHFFFPRIWVLISLVLCSFTPQVKRQIHRPWGYPRSPSKPGEQYWSEYASSISLSARLIWGSESFIAADMGAGLMMDLNRNKLHVQLSYERWRCGHQFRVQLPHSTGAQSQHSRGWHLLFFFFCSFPIYNRKEKRTLGFFLKRNNCRFSFQPLLVLNSQWSACFRLCLFNLSPAI